MKTQTDRDSGTRETHSKILILNQSRRDYRLVFETPPRLFTNARNSSPSLFVRNVRTGIEY